MKKADLLKAALEIVEKRGLSYGKPENNFIRIARLWTVYLQERVPTIDDPAWITTTDVAAMMALMKIGRLMDDHTHLDSWVDLAGYAACGAETSRAGEKTSAELGGIADAERALGLGTLAAFPVGAQVQWTDSDGEPVGLVGRVISRGGDQVTVEWPHGHKGTHPASRLVLATTAGPENFGHGFTAVETEKIVEAGLDHRIGQQPAGKDFVDANVGYASGRPKFRKGDRVSANWTTATKMHGTVADPAVEYDGKVWVEVNWDNKTLGHVAPDKLTFITRNIFSINDNVALKGDPGRFGMVTGINPYGVNESVRVKWGWGVESHYRPEELIHVTNTPRYQGHSSTGTDLL